MDRAALIDLAYKAEQKYGLPKGMLVAQLHQESSDGTNTANPEGPVGAMQIQPGTAKQYGIGDPSDPAQAIDGAGKIMADKLKTAGGDVAHALKLYYAGSEKGIGPRSNAYPGQVGSKWPMNDLVDDAVSPATSPAAASDPASADPAPAAAAPPAMSDLVDDATGHSTAPPSTSPAAAAPAAPDAPTDPYIELKAGMQNIVNHKGTTADVARYVRDMGYDPSSMANLDKNVASGQITFGQEFNPPKLADPSALDNAQTGAVQGVADVTGSLNQFAGWADKQVPALGQLDGLVGMTPQSFANTNAINMLSRNAYDQHVGGVAAGTGRLGGNLLASAPFMAAGGALAAGALPEGAGAAMLGSNKLAQLAAVNTTAGAGSNLLTSSSSDDPLSTQLERGAITGAVVGPAVGKMANGISGMIAPAIDPLTAQVATAAQKLGVRVPTWALDRSPLGQQVAAAAKYMPGSGIADDAARYQQELAGAAAKTIGEPDFSRQSIQNFKARAQDAYQNTGAGIPLRVEPGVNGGYPLVENIGNLEKDAILPPDQQKQWDKWTQHLQDQIGPDGTISHDAYRSLVQKGSPLDNLRGSQNRDIANLATAARNELKNARRLDLAPEDQAKIDQMDAQYRNWAALRSTIDPTSGTVSPAKLSRAATNADSNRLATGGGDLGAVADAAWHFRNTEGMSPTAPRSIILNNLLRAATGAPGVGLAALGLGHAGMDIGSLGSLALEGGAGLAGAAGVGKGLGALLRSPARGNLILQKALNDNPAAFGALNLFPPAAVIAANRLQAKSAPAR